MIKIEHDLGKISGSREDFRARFLPYGDLAAQETARAMRAKVEANKSVAFSTLLNSIGVFTVHSDAEFNWFVRPSVNYGVEVETGTGPAAGMARYFPDPKALEPYVKLRGGIGFTGRKGSRKRRAQEAEVRDRAGGLARFIFEHGTQPHPFAAPTAVEMAPRVIELLTAGAVAGAQAAIGANR